VDVPAGLSGDIDIQETRTSTRLNPQFNADRVTDEWKLNLESRLDIRRQRRDLADGRIVRDDRNDWRLSALAVRSVGAHMGIGIDTDFRNSVQLNQSARMRLSPAVEYNLLSVLRGDPASVHRPLFGRGRALELHRAETVFGVDRRPCRCTAWACSTGRASSGAMRASASNRTSISTTAGSFYRLGVSGDLSYRILRGLEINLSGGASLVNDNIHTPAGDISDEDILLGRQSLPSGYQYEASLGLSYRWGSSFANIVNNRFPRSVRW
jgi:hypothetical protein